MNNTPEDPKVGVCERDHASAQGKEVVTIEDLRILAPGFGLSITNMYYN